MREVGKVIGLRFVGRRGSRTGKVIIAHLQRAGVLYFDDIPQSFLCGGRACDSISRAASVRHHMSRQCKRACLPGSSPFICLQHPP